MKLSRLLIASLALVVAFLPSVPVAAQTAPMAAYFYAGPRSENGGPVRPAFGVKTDIEVPIIGKVGMLATVDLGSTGDAGIGFAKFWRLKPLRADIGIHLGAQGDLEKINATDILTYAKAAAGVIYNQHLFTIKATESNGFKRDHAVGLAGSIKRALPFEENAALKVTSWWFGLTWTT